MPRAAKPAVVEEEVVETPAVEVAEEVATPEAPVAVEIAAPEVEEEQIEEKGDSVTVTWRGGTRTYSKAVHGKEFRALAKEFCAKHDATVVK